MKKFRRKKTNLKLIIFLIVLLCTSLGYAIYTQELVINGTVSGSANFKVYFIDAWVENSSKGTTTINANADKVTYISEQYYSGCMHKRNRHLVDCSSLCICYLTEQSGGTAYTVNYARSQGLKIVNVAE